MAVYFSAVNSIFSHVEQYFSEKNCGALCNGHRLSITYLELICI